MSLVRRLSMQHARPAEISIRTEDISLFEIYCYCYERNRTFRNSFARSAAILHVQQDLLDASFPNDMIIPCTHACIVTCNTR
jgi:hypothetical protein